MTTSMFRNLGPALQQLRQERSWDSEELARRARIEPAQLNAFESGSQLPDIQVLNRLMAVLEISIAQLQEYMSWCDDAEELSRLGRVASGLEVAATPLDQHLIHLLLGQLALGKQVIRLHRRGKVQEALHEALRGKQSASQGSGEAALQGVEA